MYIASIIVYTEEAPLEKLEILVSGQSSLRVVECLQELLQKLHEGFFGAVQRAT
jgi:hypothetical protein